MASLKSAFILLVLVGFLTQLQMTVQITHVKKLHATLVALYRFLTRMIHCVPIKLQFKRSLVVAFGAFKTFVFHVCRQMLLQTVACYVMHLGHLYGFMPVCMAQSRSKLLLFLAWNEHLLHLNDLSWKSLVFLVCFLFQSISEVLSWKSLKKRLI